MIREDGDMNVVPLFARFLEYYVYVMKRSREEYIKIFNETTGENPFNVDHLCPSSHVSSRMVDGRPVSECIYRALDSVNFFCSLTERELGAYAMQYSDVRIRQSSRLLLDSVMWFLILYIITDFIQKSLFLVRKMFGGQTIRGALLSLCVQLLPGSYVDATLNIVMYSLFLYFFFLYKRFLGNFDQIFSNYQAQSSQFDARLEYYSSLQQLAKTFTDATGRILVSCLIIRFILVIHALRLVPQIGFFILTSKKMAIHLVEFGIVYGIITVIFAVVFHFVMREKDCPAKRMEEFQSITSSIFVVYTLSIGGDDNNVFVESSNVNGKIVYTAYTLISVVLLLNLIIAIMTTTADSVRQQPWKQALVSIEMWDEILGVEALFLTICSPIVALRTRIRKKAKLRKVGVKHEMPSESVTIPVVYKPWSTHK